MLRERGSAPKNSTTSSNSNTSNSNGPNSSSNSNSNSSTKHNNATNNYDIRCRPEGQLPVPLSNADSHGAPLVTLVCPTPWRRHDLYFSGLV